ncbi:DEAD/DEAH box helicase [Mesorhizobium sp. PAMC28654]|uniref:SNF2-related protein n=1 Tax=Mesorhizobium sp. PAMC28654 TaxID=2880934 RepID=UPI001D09FE55|nr:DEAD/DEAH box helicase [Mesorhizobium sp. PAMC28654]UDL89824.1 DEAD/DEAH box helicase [Mesorhizobium sp. PAMC28654]
MVLKVLDPYQEVGADWLANGPPVLYLADQMRVGKTPQCVVACARAAFKRVLVICPAIVRGHWLSEFRNFCPDRGFAENAVTIYTAKDADKIDDNTRLVIVSRDLAVKADVFAALYARGMVYGYDVVILDEAHDLTNREAKRTKLILGSKCTGNEALAGLATRCWFVSGTPQRRDASDLFPFCRMAGLWKLSRSDFTNKFCFGYHDGYEYKITGSKNLAALGKLIAPVTLRRLRSDISDIKVDINTVTIEPREVSVNHPILRLLAIQEPKFAAQLVEGLKAGDLSNIEAKSVSTTRRLIGLAKVAGVVEMVKDDLEADPGCKIAIFGIHRDPLRAVRNYLRGYRACLLFGGTSPERRDNMLHSFAANHSCRVFVGNLASAGMGIDLSAADLIYIFEPSWVPTDNAQAMSRIINVREPDRLKEVRFVGLSNSIDDAVTRICERRTREIEDLYRAV